MPIVFSRDGADIHFIPSEEALGEILGHTNFDGHDWQVGDRIVFEDGSQSVIENAPGGSFPPQRVLSSARPKVPLDDRDDRVQNQAGPRALHPT